MLSIWAVGEVHPPPFFREEVSHFRFWPYGRQSRLLSTHTVKSWIVINACVICAARQLRLRDIASYMLPVLFILVDRDLSNKS